MDKLLTKTESRIAPSNKQLAKSGQPFVSYIIKAALLTPLLLLLLLHFIFFLSEKISFKGRGLTGYYYKGIDFLNLLFIRNDGMIYFDSDNFPENAPKDNFSVQWKGQILAPMEGKYIFGTMSDDGVRLWIDNILLIDNWHMHAETMNENKIHLSKGLHTVRLHYFQATFGKTIKLFWAQPGDIIKPVASNYLRPISPQGSKK